MTRLQKTPIALFLAVAALALGSCGGGDGGGDSTTGANTTENPAVGTDSTTGTDKNGTTGTNENGTTGKTDTGGSNSDDKGGSGGGGGSDDSSGSGGGGSDDSSGGGGGGGGSDRKTPEKELSGKNVYSTSKTVCNSFLPTALARDLKSGKQSAEDIAKDYSRGYPEKERDRAYDGCLAGLKIKQKQQKG